MFISFVIPTSIRTRKQWLIDTMETQFIGGYLIMIIAVAPPVIFGWIFGAILSSAFAIQNELTAVLYISGFLLFLWDRWLRLSYNTDIKLVYIPIEYLSYVAMGLALFFIYGN